MTRAGLACAALAALAWSQATSAAPTAGELIKTCEAALKQDYKTINAAMCDWYVAPCGVCGKDGPPKPDWCLPPTLVGPARAAEIVALLKAVPARAAEPAPAVVKSVLQARYPCPAP